MSYTTGPWHHDIRSVHIYDTNMALIASVDQDHVPHDQVEANRDLIAAAPDLLNACLQADDMLGRYYSADDKDTRGGLALKAIRDAIKKATGAGS